MSTCWLIALLALSAGSQQSQAGAQLGTAAVAPQVEKSQKEFAFYPGGSLVVSAAAAGNVKVVGWEKSAVRVEVERLFFYLTSEQAQAASIRFPVSITNTPTTVRISTLGAKLPEATMAVNLLVYVPAVSTDVAIRTNKGDISVADFNGSIELTLEEGNVEARNLSGYFSAVTKRGDLQVTLSGQHWTGHSFTAATQRGNIDLRLPADYSATLQLETRDGEISIDYPPQVVSGAAVQLQVLARKKARSVNVSIGAGGTAIKLMTSAGDIRFSAKQ